MKFKLSDILESTILTEGRKEDAMAKYGASKELVDRLSSEDPSGNNKYLDWMVKQVMGSGTGENIPLADAVIDAITRYHQQVNRLTPEMAQEAGVSDKVKKNPKDINTFNDINELVRIIKIAEQKVTDKEVRKEVEKIYEDDNILVNVPLTVRASCKYGAGTKWCITSRTEASGYNTQFDSYSKNAIFYFITDKTTTQAESSRNYKFALQYGHNGEKTWWDANDDSHRTAPRFIDTDSGHKAMEVINAYHRGAVGKKLEREIQKFILQPSSRKYKDYREHITPEQKNEVVTKIIRDEGATVQVLESLVQDLTERQKNSLLHNLVGLNNSSFSKIKEQLNNLQLMNVLRNNPIILNSSESIKYIDNVLDDEEKFDLAGTLDKSKISNTDSKVLLKKWSMTPEERASHGAKSTYVFLYNKSGKRIEKVVKVDSLNPESYKTINGLKLRSTMDKNLIMHAVKTETDLLDEYIDKSSDDIPADVEAGMLKKAITI